MGAALICMRTDGQMDMKLKGALCDYAIAPDSKNLDCEIVVLSLWAPMPPFQLL
jgi:hypothetical protein